MEITTGTIVKSLAGHDKEEVFFILREEGEYVYLVDGKYRTLDKPKKKNRKHDYQLNFVRAYHIIRKFLKEKSGRIPPYVESMIEKEILPVRLHRKNQRKVKPKSPEPFNYRYD